MMPVQWLLVFCDPPPCPEGAGWRERLLYRGLSLLRPGFRHVFAVRPSEAFDGWVMVNPHSGSLDVVEVPRDAVFWWDGSPLLGEQWFDSLFVMAERGLVHLAVVVGVQRQEFQPRGLLTCVAVVKHLIGWNKSGTTFTPWQLYRAVSHEGVQAMGGVFGGGGGKPDTSAADKARADAEREKEELKKKNQAKLSAMRARQSGGRGSLLDFAGASGGTGASDQLGG